MNKAALPIFARLQALQTIAQVAAGGARVIATISDANPLAALLCEVNETVLGRTLTFDSSGGSSLTLEVSGRRVLRAVAANGLPEAESCLAADSLEDEHKDNLIKLLQAVATPRHELRVWALPMTREVDGVSVGLPVALLADLLLIDLNPLGREAFVDAAPTRSPNAADRPTTRPADRSDRPYTAPAPDPRSDRPVTAPPRLSERLGAAAAEKLDAGAPSEPASARAIAAVADAPFLGTFAKDVGPDLMAWLIVGGEGDGTAFGPDEMVSHLQGFLEDEGPALGAQLDQVSSEAGAAVCIVLGASLVEGHSILCARKGISVLLGVIEGDATQTILRAWGNAMRG